MIIREAWNIHATMSLNYRHLYLMPWYFICIYFNIIWLIIIYKVLSYVNTDKLSYISHNPHSSPRASIFSLLNQCSLVSTWPGILIILTPGEICDTTGSIHFTLPRLPYTELATFRWALFILEASFTRLFVCFIDYIYMAYYAMYTEVFVCACVGINVYSTHI